jgi:tetratricopeptide (TPR) repeat protein
MTELHAHRYKAFISYSHADEKWAAWLHKALETYRVPKHLVGTRTRLGLVPERVAPVFRDRDELASSTDLGSDLREALSQSATQIVICSRSSAQSHWVNEEILAYKRLGRSDRIFCLIVDGEPYSSSRPGQESEECFAPALHYLMGDDGELTNTPAEPIAADARPGKDGRNNARMKLLAGILGVGFDALRQREMQRRQRRMAIVASLSTVGMLVAIGLATTAILARNEADRQRGRAENEAETARQTSSFLVSLFEVSDPSESRGRSITAREILTNGASRIDVELAGQPEVQTRLMTTIGQVYTSLGLYDDARSLLRSALSRRRQLSTVNARELSESLIGLGEVETLTADFATAEGRFQESIEGLRSSGDENSPEMAEALAGLAEVYYQQGRYEEAQPLLQQVLAHRQRNLGGQSPAVADAIEELGLNEFDQGNFEVAAQRLREALALRRKLLGDEPHPDIAENLNNLALVLLELGDYGESETLYREALAMNRRLHGDSHPEVAMLLTNLGQLLVRSGGDPDTAERYFRDALAMKRATLGDAHPDVALVLNELSFLDYDRGRLDEAIDSARSALAVQEEALGREHPEVAATLSRLGRWLAEAGRNDEAQALLREAVALSRRLLGEGHPDLGIAEMGLADALTRGGDLDEALALASSAEATLAAAFGGDHWITAVGRSVKGGVLLRMGRLEQAEPILTDSYRQLAAAEGAREIYVRAALERVITLYDQWGKREPADRYRRALASMAG